MENIKSIISDLEDKLSVEKNTSEQISLSIKLFRLYFHFNFDKSREYITQAIALAEKISDYEYLVAAHIHFAKLCLFISNFNDAELQLQIAMNYIDVHEIVKHKAELFKTYGDLAITKEEPLNAFKYYSRAMEYVDYSDDKNCSGLILNGFGSLFSMIGLNERALEYHRNAIDTFISNDSSKNLIRTYNNIAGACIEDGKYEIAYEYLSRINNWEKIPPLKSYYNVVKSKEAFLLSALGRYEEAVSLWDDLIGLSFSPNELWRKSFSILEKAKCLIKMNKIQDAEANLHSILSETKYKISTQLKLDVYSQLMEIDSIKYGEIQTEYIEKILEFSTSNLNKKLTDKVLTKLIKYLKLNKLNDYLLKAYKLYNECCRMLNDEEISLLKIQYEILNMEQESTRKNHFFTNTDKLQKLLLNIANTVNICPTMEELYKEIHINLQQVIDTSNFFIALYNKDTDTLKLPYFIDSVDSFSEMPAGKTLTSYAIKKGKTVVLNSKMMQKLTDDGIVELVGTPSRTWIGIPLKIRDFVIGLLSVQSYSEDTILEKADIELLEIIADQVALAIDRKLAERQLVEERDFAESVIQTAPAIVIVLDLDGNILKFNSFIEELSGYRASEVVGENWLDMFVDGSQREDVREKLKLALKTGNVKGNINSIITKDGLAFEVEWFDKVLYDADGNKIGFLAIGLDITERKRTELALSQSQKMEAIGTLAGGIAHDFNNILSIILGYSELALLDVNPESKAYDRISEISNAGMRAKDLVQQILTFSRKSVTETQPLEIGIIVKETMKMLRASLPTTISFELNIRSTRMVNADPTQIQQIIMNLCTNSYHAMRENGGVLTVELIDLRYKKIKPEIRQNLDKVRHVLLRVKDTGQGISSSSLSKIFDPYYTTKPKEEGTGLGLAIIHGIVNSYNGFIDVQSEPGKGTSFDIYIPAVKRDTEEHLEDDTGEIVVSNASILFVDDEKSLTDVYSDILGKFGYKVTSFQNPLDAVKYFEDNHREIDLIITDMTMPNLTGIQFSEIVKKIKPEQKIILCTGYSELLNNEMLQKAGISLMLKKPLITAEIISGIEKVLE